MGLGIRVGVETGRFRGGEGGFRDQGVERLVRGGDGWV